MGLFLAFQFYYIDLGLDLTRVPQCLDYYSFKISFEIGKAEPSKFDLVFQVPSNFPVNFRSSFSISAKRLAGILIEIMLHLPMKFK